MNLLKNKHALTAAVLGLLTASACGLKITCESMAVSGSADANLANIKTLISAAQGELVIFPELALCNAASGKEQAWVDSALADLRALCLARKKAVIVGTARKSGGLTYNSAYYINASGVLAGTYDQIHAQSPYSPGMKIPVFALQTTEGLVRFGIQIGTDLYVPEPWQFFAENGVRCMLLVYLSGLTGTQAWEKEIHDDLLMAHAGDNGSFAASASAVNPNALVKSQVVDGAGTVLFAHDPVSAGKAEAQISFLNPGFIMFKRHDEWRRDLYQLVIKNPTAAETVQPEVAGPAVRVFPNPFNQRVTITAVSRVQAFKLYDVSGRLIEAFKPDAQSVIWDAGRAACGVYILKCSQDGRELSQKLFLEK